MNIDRLYESVNKRGHVCLGLDTSTALVPPLILKACQSEAEAVLTWNKAVIDATSDIVACYKVQIAYYEQLGLAGLAAYSQTLNILKQKNLLAIADIKRGDIADTAACYAKAHFDGEFEADFVTLSPYMGMDTLEPWMQYIRNNGKGAFVLMRTSNPGMKDFEYKELVEGQRLYNAVGRKLEELNQSGKGSCGYGSVGAVIGCTEQEEAAEIRNTYPSLFFLIPGYGAQGGAAADAALLLRNGNGGVVNASRSLMGAWKKTIGDSAGAEAAAAASRDAALAMRDAIRGAVLEASR